MLAVVARFWSFVAGRLVLCGFFGCLVVVSGRFLVGVGGLGLVLVVVVCLVGVGGWGWCWSSCVPDLSETALHAFCCTSGMTGLSKAAGHSHRLTHLHTLVTAGAPPPLEMMKWCSDLHESARSCRVATVPEHELDCEEVLMSPSFSLRKCLLRMRACHAAVISWSCYCQSS